MKVDPASWMKMVTKYKGNYPVYPVDNVGPNGQLKCVFVASVVRVGLREMNTVHAYDLLPMSNLLDS